VVHCGSYHHSRSGLCDQDTTAVVSLVGGERRDLLIVSYLSLLGNFSVVPSAYSSYTKLLDVTAYVLHFAHNFRQKLFKLKGLLTPSELSIANIKWLTNVNDVMYAFSKWQQGGVVVSTW